MIRAFVITLVFSAVSFSMPQYLNLLSAKVPSGALKDRCVTCHASKGSLALNSFGKDYYAIFVQQSNIKFPGIATATLPQKWDLLLNKLDSNKNGQVNYQDIIQGLNPGL